MQTATLECRFICSLLLSRPQICLIINRHFTLLVMLRIHNYKWHWIFKSCSSNSLPKPCNVAEFIPDSLTKKTHMLYCMYLSLSLSLSSYSIAVTIGQILKAHSITGCAHAIYCIDSFSQIQMNNMFFSEQNITLENTAWLWTCVGFSACHKHMIQETRHTIITFNEESMNYYYLVQLIGF